MRLTAQAVEYSQYLLNIGEDRVAKNTHNEITLDEHLLLRAESIADCLSTIYPAFDNPMDLFSENCILVPKNKMVRHINSVCIQRFPGRLREYNAINDVTEGADITHFPIEFLDSLEISGLPPHKLQLKIGSPIILMRNLDPPKLCNGTSLIVHDLYNNLILARITSGSFKNHIVMIPRVSIYLSEDEGVPLRRRQFPVQSCFAMSIHKAQGQTMENVLIDLEEPVFQHGQLYVALSRVRNSQNVKVFLPAGNATKNIVIQSVLY
jgi:ATP-dependent DNA helicase PIF1